MQNFRDLALGSASELAYFELLARDLKFLDEPGYEHISSDAQEVKRMLTALIARLKADT